MDELKPCPFCGGEADFYIGGSGYIQCAHCLAMIPYRYGLPYADGKQQAIAAWNRRPTPENKPLTLEQLRQMEGEPVWIQRGKKGTYRVVKDVSCGGTYGGEVRFTDSGPTGLRIEDYCKTWVPYARKPIQEDKNEKAD